MVDKAIDNGEKDWKSMSVQNVVTFNSLMFQESRDCRLANSGKYVAVKMVLVCLSINTCKYACVTGGLSVDGDADAAVEARIRIGRNKFTQFEQGGCYGSW